MSSELASNSPTSSAKRFHVPDSNVATLVEKFHDDAPTQKPSSRIRHTLAEMAGTLSVKQCIAKAVEMQIPALAITDTNNLTGAIEFYIEVKKAGIKPIVGVELRTTSEQAVVLAKDYAGYITLCEMVTKLCEEYPAARMSSKKSSLHYMYHAMENPSR